MKTQSFILIVSSVFIFNLAGCYIVLQSSDNYLQNEQEICYYPPNPDPYPPAPVQPIVIIVSDPVQNPGYKTRPGNERSKYDGANSERDPLRNGGDRGDSENDKRGRR